LGVALQRQADASLPLDHLIGPASNRVQPDISWIIELLRDFGVENRSSSLSKRPEQIGERPVRFNLDRIVIHNSDVADGRERASVWGGRCFITNAVQRVLYGVGGNGITVRERCVLN